jgi:hypothetical protein
MFLTLLVVTLVVAVVVAAVVVHFFTPSLQRILRRIVADEISSGWLQYLRFATLVVGISAGVRIHELERYVNPRRYEDETEVVLELTRDRWILEIYRTIIETLEGIAWMLLWFFVVALVAYVIVRVFELKRGRNEGEPTQDAGP